MFENVWKVNFQMQTYENLEISDEGYNENNSDEILKRFFRFYWGTNDRQ